MSDLVAVPELLSLRQRYPWAEFGEGSYGGLNIFKWDESTKLRVGAYCSFSFDTRILLGGEHRIDWVTTFPFSALWDVAKDIKGHPATSGDVVIGNDVWVGAGALILSGVTIGDGAVIAARTLLTAGTKVPPYSIWGGTPGKQIGVRFHDRQIDRLMRIKWWEWSKDRICYAMPMLLSKNIDEFLEFADGEKA